MRNKGIIIILVVMLVVSWIILAFVMINNRLDSPLTGEIISNKSDKGDFLGKKIVSKVIDGDTVIIEGESVRLLGMDTDERGYPCFTPAKKRIEELVLSKEVVLEKDVEDKDQYKRYLRFIFLDGRNINLQMVEEGLAVARYTGKGEKYKAEILAAERNAQKKRIGCKWTEEQIKVIDEEEKNTADEKIDSSDYECGSNKYNCDDFSSQAEAQRAFDACFALAGDVHKLDRDGDKEACETLS